jgi:hypothetical protein
MEMIDAWKPMEVAAFHTMRLSDEDLARLRKSAENHFVERKSFGDWKKDVVKTLVAFANSLPIGQPGFLFIGLRIGVKWTPRAKASTKSTKP